MFGKRKKDAGAASSNDSKKGNSHLESLVNARNRINAHRNINYLLAGLLVFSMWNTYRVSANAPVRLVPYNWATARGIAEVSAIGEESGEYLSHIATADLQLYTNWNPVTVKTQYRRFLNRMAGELYAKESTRLLIESEEHNNKPHSQAFFTRRIHFVNSDTVELEGEQVRWEGDTEILRIKGKYTLQYRWLVGVPYIKGIAFDSSDRRVKQGGQS